MSIFRPPQPIVRHSLNLSAERIMGVDPAAAKTLGVVVVGQSPRPDIVAQLRAVIPSDIGIAVRGSLDGMGRDDIAKLKPANGYDALFTRLPGGEAVKISKQAVERRALGAVDAFAAEGVTATMMCCTGDFPLLEAQPGVVLPSAVLAGIVHGLLPRGRLGLFVPIPDQVGTLDQKWRREGIEIVSVPMTPGCTDEEIEGAVEQMQALSPDLVVLDCMSYTQAMKDRVRQGLRAPVILGISAAARVVSELVA
jgi:protein AroM